jgi:hypothetical protein
VIAGSVDTILAFIGFEAAEPLAGGELWTEDAFGGRVRGPDDLVSRVVELPYVNPQTGPFYVEGAEPGDTLAIHFDRLRQLGRDYLAGGG